MKSLGRFCLYILGVALVTFNTSMACTCLKLGMLSSVAFFGVGAFAGLGCMALAGFGK